jgi:hypothetical protein
MQPVRACTSTALSALWSLECILSTCPFGAAFSGITPLFPRSVPGRITRPCLLCSFIHRSIQLATTLRFSRSSHYSIGWPSHSSTRCFRATPGVSGACHLLCPRVRNCIRITAQAPCICLARPDFLSLAWKHTIRPFSQRSNGGPELLSFPIAQA